METVREKLERMRLVGVQALVHMYLLSALILRILSMPASRCKGIGTYIETNGGIVTRANLPFPLQKDQFYNADKSTCGTVPQVLAFLRQI